MAKLLTTKNGKSKFVNDDQMVTFLYECYHLAKKYDWELYQIYVQICESDFTPTEKAIMIRTTQDNPHYQIFKNKKMFDDDAKEV